MVVPARRVKTEYMKRFKEPKWESCGACYLELLHYRLSRGGDTAISRALLPPARSWPGLRRSHGCGTRGVSLKSRVVEKEDQEKQEKEEQEKTVEHTSVKEADKTSRTGRRPSRSALSSRNDRKSAKSPQRTDAPKENKHPFALYGWGERQTDTGSQKTHNVCASASVNEIHESALRAKNRRQVEKRKLSQRRVRSAEAENTWRTKPSPADNPWMTEYMRCYSARAL
ncbi:PREDICTED: centriole, cilia and spindle-associated protein [Ficedula albicollis]|uniref:centriole, cilia and spindle-associated protein n=1 Tax=Ficedula albicollis TaxID=59894 RepID=UPI0007AD7C81|nr:PREDICTED: centriole, cilia and spindle-associated protein [Ficedula albicollis]